MAVEQMPRFFAMSRCAGLGGDARFQPSGWYVCDARDKDKNKLARPIHEDPLDMEEAKELAQQMNEDD